MKKLEEISESELKAITTELYYDMKGCVATSKLVGSVMLPDGRKAQIQIIVDTDEGNFISED